MRWGIWTLVWVALCAPGVASWGADQDGRDLFEKRCSACHKLPDPTAPPPEGWAVKLNLMAPLARLKSPQQQVVLAYLTSHTQAAASTAALEEDRLFFEGKCSLCHSLDRIYLMPLTDESRRHVVHRMQQRSGTGWLSDEDAERVLDYLANATLPEPGTTLAGTETSRQIFSARCSACHSLERVFAGLAGNERGGSRIRVSTDGREVAVESWAHVVNRMRGKAPQWMTEDEAQQIVEWLGAEGFGLQPSTTGSD